MAIHGSPDQSALRLRWTLLGVAGLAGGLIVVVALGAPVQTVVGLLLVAPILSGVVGAVLGMSRDLRRRFSAATPRSMAKPPEP
ncbi:MAG TPA: hypothetical protein VIA62_01845 [Thermoanaerobaculia bacterium]|jgi:hypothetical protein|nr:hypothetical protein [Thermoanaerobaculia bacterium]